MSQFNFLYFFQSESFALIEVKREGLPEGTPPEQIYSWLLINFQTKAIRELHFKSISKNDGIEMREFDEGKFVFNDVEGKLTLVAGNFSLKRTSPKNVPLHLRDAIESFLNE